jgi:hypothetical protein
VTDLWLFIIRHSAKVLLVGKIIRKLKGLIAREMGGYVRARLNAPSLRVKIQPSPKNQYKGDIPK